MQKVMIKIANPVSKLLGIGEHVVTVTEVSEKQSAANPEYADRTPQLQVVFKTEDGKQTTGWYNMLGYKRFSELSEEDQVSGAYSASTEQGYAIDNKSNERVTSEENTNAALSILGKLGDDCGLATGETISLEQFSKTIFGCQVGISIAANNRNQTRVQFSMRPDQVEAPAVAEI